MSADKSTTKKTTYLALPMFMAEILFPGQQIPKGATADEARDIRKKNLKVALLAQGIPEDAIDEKRVFAVPNWAYIDLKTGNPRQYTGQEVLLNKLGKHVTAIIGHRFDERDTISFLAVAQAEYAQFISIVAGLNGKELECLWKHLLAGKDNDGKHFSQFTYGARCFSPQVGCERHKFPNTDNETGALPTLDGKSLIWYPFVGPDIRILQLNETQHKLKIECAKVLDQKVAALNAKNKEAKEKLFNKAIEAALAVQLEIHPATVEQEAMQKLEDALNQVPEGSKVQVLEKVDV